MKPSGKRHEWIFVNHTGRICERCRARKGSGRYVDRGLTRAWYCDTCADKEQ